MIKTLIICLLLTLAVELSVSALLGIRKKDDLLLVICANTCTNPVVVYLSNCINQLHNDLLYVSAVAVLEILAVIVEFIVFKKGLQYQNLPPLAVSFINNATSFGLGLIITNYL